MEWYYIIGLLFLFIIIGSQLFMIIGSISLLLFYFYIYHEMPENMFDVVKAMFDTVNKPVLLSIPLYVFAGAIMSRGEIAKRLIDLAMDSFGWLKGGLAVASVAACIFFAAISGSSPVTLIAIGTIMYPALIKNGYPDKVALGVLTVSGSLGILIPPSIPMIVYSIVTGTDVNQLFMAGVIPGAITGFFLVILCIYYGYKYDLKTKTFNLKELLKSIFKGIPALLMPIIILGGIYSGIFTVTEAAAVAAVYAILIEVFLYRDLKFKDLVETLYDSVIILGVIFIIIAMATIFNRFLTYQQVPVMLVDLMKTFVDTEIKFILCSILVLLIVGLFMDIISAILIMAPLLVGYVNEMQFVSDVGFNVNFIHLGIIFIMALEIGFLTPPIGINLFVSSSVFDQPFPKVVAGSIPFTICILISLALIAFIPDIALFLTSFVE